MMGYLVVALCAAFAADAAAYADAPLWTQLGAEDAMSGLRVSSQPDGRFTVAEIAGRACKRTNVEDGSTYLYVDVDDAFTPEPELFVTAEFCNLHGIVSLEYDAGEGISAYRPAPEAYTQDGSETWRTETFTLRYAEFQDRQNGGNDFRLHADGPLAVARIELSRTPPEGFTPSHDPQAYFEERPPVETPKGMTVIQQWQIHEPVSENQLADSAYEAAKQGGITSLQSYVGWAQIEPRPGETDFSCYDPVVAQIERHGLKWLPFLITAPYIATPEWFQAEHGVDSVCLEHGESIAIQSIWNPELRAGVRRFLEIFQSHYPAEVIEALNLGISGNWGESIMVAGGGFGMKDAHTHLGWWCGDVHARADLRRWAEDRYETVEALNAAWDTSYAAFTEIEPFIPFEAPSRRAAVDLFAWYTESMTDYAEHWIRITRELYPDTPIYLCTGGNGQPELGADFAAQARMAARYGAGIRITNQSDDAPGNFAVTRMVSSSSRLYDSYYTTEPGGANTPKGIACRVFDAVSGGAVGVYFKTLIDPPDRLSATAVQLAENMHLLQPNTPELTVAALMPNSSLVLDRETLNRIMERAQVLRDALDFEFIDENMINDGLLARFRALVVLAGDTVERPTLEAIGRWVAEGGVVVLPQESAPLRDVEDTPAAWWPLDEANPAAAPHGEGHVIALPGEWPAWRDPMARTLLDAGPALPWGEALAEPIDGIFDHVLATRCGDRIYYYNNTDSPIVKQTPLGDVITIGPRSIVRLHMPR